MINEDIADITETANLLSININGLFSDQDLQC